MIRHGAARKSGRYSTRHSVCFNHDDTHSTSLIDEFEKYGDVFSKAEQKMLHMIFTQLDTQGDGKLRLDALQQFILKQGEEVSMDGISAIDINKDGYVDAEEFLHFMAKTQMAQSLGGKGRASRRSQQSSWSVAYSDGSASDADEGDDESDIDIPFHVPMLGESVRNELDNLRDQLEHERKRRVDMQAELEHIANDAGFEGGAVPMAEYEKLKEASDNMQQQLKELSEQKKQTEEQYRQEVNDMEDARAEMNAALGGRRLHGTLPTIGARFSHSAVPRRLTGLGVPSQTQGSQHPQRRTIGQMPSRPRNSSVLSRQSLDRISHDEAFELAKGGSSSSSSAVGQASPPPSSERGDAKLRQQRDVLVLEVKGLLTEISSMRQQQEGHANCTANEVLKILNDQPHDLDRWRGTVERAATLLSEHQEAELAKPQEHSLGAQLELAETTCTIDHRLQCSVHDIRRDLQALKESLSNSSEVTTEQTLLCKRITKETQLARAAAATAVSQTSEIGSGSGYIDTRVAERMAEAFEDQLALLLQENDRVASVVASLQAAVAKEEQESTMRSQQTVFHIGLESDVLTELCELKSQVGRLCKISELKALQEDFQALDNYMQTLDESTLKLTSGHGDSALEPALGQEISGTLRAEMPPINSLQIARKQEMQDYNNSQVGEGGPLVAADFSASPGCSISPGCKGDPSETGNKIITGSYIDETMLKDEGQGSSHGLLKSESVNKPSFASELQQLHAQIAKMQIQVEKTEYLRDAVLGVVHFSHASDLESQHRTSLEPLKSQHRWQRRIWAKRQDAIQGREEDLPRAEHPQKSVRYRTQECREHKVLEALDAGEVDRGTAELVQDKGLQHYSRIGSQLQERQEQQQLQSKHAFFAGPSTSELELPNQGQPQLASVISQGQEQTRIASTGVEAQKQSKEERKALRCNRHSALSPEQLEQRKAQEARLEQIVQHLSIRFEQEAELVPRAISQDLGHTIAMQSVTH